jgi:hypothetical protein
MNIYAMPQTSPQSPETPISKGDRASEVGRFNLTQTSLQPHPDLTSTSPEPHLHLLIFALRNEYGSEVKVRLARQTSLASNTLYIGI